MKKFSAVPMLPTGIAISSVAIACASITSLSSTRFATSAVATSAVATNVVAVQLQATPPVRVTQLDLSSPEKSVRSFIAAANANRFEEAALCVDGASPEADFKPLRELMGGEQPNISLSVLSSSINGDRAALKAKVTVKGGKSQQSQTGNIALVRRGARWLLVPADMKTPSASVNYLSGFAAMVRSPQIIADAMSRARESARRSSCSSNLKQMAIAAMMMMQDNDEKIAMTPQNFKAKLLPHAGTMQVFRCPSIKSGESYSFNGNLANRSLSAVANPSRTVMFYEGRNGQLDFRHLGLCNVAFVDGHVKAISRSEAKTLRWKP